MGANREQKVYTLDNGVDITPSSLAKEVGLSIPAARCRLDKYTDPVAVFRAVGTTIAKRRHKCKAYTLSDGSRQTARELAKKYNIPLSTVRNRLSNGVTDIVKLKKEPNSAQQRAQQGRPKNESTSVPGSRARILEAIKSRGIGDEMLVLALKKI